MKMRAPDGSLFEMQLHTPQSQIVHQKNHRAYEKWRALPPLSSLNKEDHEEDLAQHDKLMNQMHEANLNIEIPEQLDELTRTLQRMMKN